MPRTRLALAVLLLLAVTGVASAAAARGARRVEIAMRGNAFRPRQVDIAPGDTVVWINRDIVRHNAVARGRFDTGELRGGERYAWVAADTGRMEYRCTVHQNMRGVIRVQSRR